MLKCLLQESDHEGVHTLRGTLRGNGRCVFSQVRNSSGTLQHVKWCMQSYCVAAAVIFLSQIAH